MKACRRCKVDKPPSDFSKNKARKDGLSSYCRPCCRGIKSGAIPRVGTSYKTPDPNRTTLFHYKTPEEVLAATTRLVRHYLQPKVHRVTEQDVEDTVSTALEEFVRRAYDPTRSVPEAFIFVVVKSTCRRFWKSKKRKKRRAEVLTDPTDETFSSSTTQI